MALLTLAGLLLGGALGDRLDVIGVISLQGYAHVLVGLLAGPLLGGRAALEPAATASAPPDR